MTDSTMKKCVEMTERLKIVSDNLPLIVDEFFDVVFVMERLARLLADPAASEREAALKAGAEILKRYDQPKILNRKYPAPALKVKAPAVDPSVTALLERYKAEVAARPKSQLTSERTAEINALIARTEGKGKLLDQTSVFNLYRNKWVPEAIASGDADLIGRRVLHFEALMRRPMDSFMKNDGGGR